MTVNDAKRYLRDVLNNRSDYDSDTEMLLTIVEREFNRPETVLYWVYTGLDKDVYCAQTDKDLYYWERSTFITGPGRWTKSTNPWARYQEGKKDSLAYETRPVWLPELETK